MSALIHAYGLGPRGGMDFLSMLRLPEVAITGTATLTTAALGRLHICSGTSANYTVTLPAAASCTGQFLGFRMSPSLTKLVTLDGNASEAIDGATTRVMWARESALLLCDGSNWFKIAGKSLPMACWMYKAADSANLTTGVWTKFLLDTVQLDTTGLMADTGNTRINILRPSRYVVDGIVFFNHPGAANMTRMLASVYWNAAQGPLSDNGAPLASGYGFAPCPITPVDAVANDYFELYGNMTFSSGTPSMRGSTKDFSHLGIYEMVVW